MPLLGRGFVSGPKSLVKMLQGDFSADLEDARVYENAAAIGQSSKKGMGAFFNNTAMSFAYTAGIIGEAILEEAAGALLSPITAGGSFFAATANNARKIGKIGDAFDMATKGYKAINTTLKEANNINGARKMWKAAENIGASKIGKFLNPVENTFDAVIGIGKNADNLTGLARLAQGTSRTAGGLFRDVRNINMALSEARLEAGMNDNAVYDKSYDAFYKKNGRAPSDDEQYQLTKNAKESGMNTLMWNTALIFASNKIVIPNLLKSGISKRALQSKVDDVLNLKGGKVVFEKTAEAGKKIAKGEFNYVENSLKNSLKGFKKAPVSVTAKVAGRYLKANLMEGVQENLQEVISTANEEYYLTAYKNKELGAHLYNRAQSSLMYEKLGDQFSAQGFETFASGALMGLFSGGLNAVKGGLDYGYNNIFNKAKYQEYKDLRKTHGEGVANRLTALYADPKEFFNSRVFNYGVQNNTVSGVEDANTKEAKDELSDAFVSQVHTALDTNTLNYFKDHIASFKETSPEEFEEAFGFEKGTGAKEQEKIDKVLNNIDSIEKSYKYATDRFPNPVNLADFDQASPDYTKAAIFHSAWENAKKSYVFSNHAFMNTTKRMSDISGSILNNPSMQNMSQLDMDLIFQPSRIYNETVMLKNEIAGLKDVKDPSNKQQIQEKEDRLNALEKFLEAHTKHDVYNNRTTADAVLEAYKKEAGIEELSDEEKELILDKAFGEKNAENKYKTDAELEDAYKNYIKTVNGVDKNYIFDTDVDKSFEQLLDHYKLGNESKKLVTYINLLHNPEGFVNQVEKAQTWMTDMYNNRKPYYTDMVNKQIANLENNEALNALANRNIFIDLDAFQAYMNDDILPEEFFDETTKQVIPKGSEKYNEAISILILNKRVKSEDVEKPTLDDALQSEVDRLDAQEEAEIDKLEKVETIKTIKKVVAKDIKLTIDDILNDIDESQYVDAKYDGKDEIITMYFGFDGLRLNDSKGELLDTDTIKDKFSEYKIYTKKLQANPEQVTAIKEKYDALRDEAANKHADKKAKTKADVYSNYTPVEQLPKDLYKELQEVFQQTETAIKADEDETSDEELMDLFKVFVKTNPLAEEVINEYNDKSKDAVEKEKLGEIDDFDFILNNKKLNTAAYSIDDIKIFRGQFEELRDEADSTITKTAYQDVITKFNKLISTRDIQNFTPEVQEIIKTLKNELFAKQSGISKLGEEGYAVKGQILARVSNFIEKYKTEKYRYTGADIVKAAYDMTIGNVGFNEKGVKYLINKLKAELHIESVEKNYGYTDETEALLKKHLKNLLVQDLNKVLFKNKEELLEDIQAFISENTYEASRDGGTYVDDELRKFFTKGEAPVFDEKKITREAYDNLFGPTSFLKPIKQRIDAGQLYTVATNLKVYDVDSNVAGEMDLLLIDKEGKLHIIDFKTGNETKWDGFVTQTKFSKNKLEAYTLQQYTYARLLKKMTGLDADINIFPIETTLDQNSKNVLTAGAPTNTKLNGPGKWYFSLDPNFTDAKAKIDKAISIEAPVVKVATELNPVYKKQLVNLGYPIGIINDLTKEQAAELTKDNVPYKEYIKQTSGAKMSFGKATAETVTPTNAKADEDYYESPYGAIAANYLFTGGKGVILSTDYLLQALTSVFPYSGKAIDNIRNKYANKLSQILKDDINTDTYNSVMQEIRDAINNTYGNEKANEIFEKILKNATGFTLSREGNQVSSDAEKLNEDAASATSRLSQPTPTTDAKADVENKIKAFDKTIENEFEEGDYLKVLALAEKQVKNGTILQTPENIQLLTNYPKLFEELIKATDARNKTISEFDKEKVLAGTPNELPIYGIESSINPATGRLEIKWVEVRKEAITNIQLTKIQNYAANELINYKNKLQQELAALETPAENKSVVESVLDTKDIDKRRNKAYGSIQFNYSTDEGYYGIYTDAQGKEELIESWNEKAIKAILKEKYDAEVAALQPQTGPVTKASELNLQKEDTVVVKEVIPEFAEKGDTLTVLKSDENSVSFTNKGKEKTLSLQELNKHTTTMDILKTEQAESTPEILDAIDKQTINETVDAFNTFMGDTDAIAAAIKEADAKSMSEIEDDLLNNLDC
jgi:hypothetical protein